MSAFDKNGVAFCIEQSSNGFFDAWIRLPGGHQANSKGFSATSSALAWIESQYKQWRLA